MSLKLALPQSAFAVLLLAPAAMGGLLTCVGRWERPDGRRDTASACALVGSRHGPTLPSPAPDGSLEELTG
ncbi:hypothetical protein SAV14893_089630 [Streptomyces avermitilis]|uniref:Uncharacterized protein n=1 Tax=Streptomyces avermitilis TaxID=33903 RepID=A0A4D4N5J8_STRAX|nr:hypothetical protein SAVMC3_06930 [Streptomyces avermitilis]GDY69570.1 hypothetical protein SAV14893_089630 [Streptomyces avermitilis]GDY79828.1 hypothetical protein SAV31267_093130 [Streptomyces avermitilis]